MAKKIAFFVEGPTEEMFVIKYLREIICQQGFHFRIYSGFGGSATNPRFFVMKSDVVDGQSYEAYIYVSQGDSKVNSDLLDQLSSVRRSGVTQIVALKDLRGRHNGTVGTLANLPMYEQGDKYLFQTYSDVKSIIAVMEIETWFIAETNHYSNLCNGLTQKLILANTETIGCNPYDCTYENIEEPAETLDRIYQLVQRHYSKKQNTTKKTINALDYVNLYSDVKTRIAKLKEFADVIDKFFGFQFGE